MFIDNSCVRGGVNVAPPRVPLGENNIRCGTTIYGLPGTPHMGTDVNPDFPTAHVIVWGYPVFLC